MCVVFACPVGGKLPTMDELLGGALANDDGAGVAWADPAAGSVWWKKGLKHVDVEKLIEDGILKPPCVIHYRITSSGENCDELTHPFLCTPDTPLALEGRSDGPPLLFHNGTVMHWKEEAKLAFTSAKGTLKVPDGEWSDTRALAFLVGMYGPGYLEFVDGLVGDKVAMLYPDGNIRYFGNWFHKDGFYASNESYLNGRKGKGGVVGFTRGEMMVNGQVISPANSGGVSISRADMEETREIVPCSGYFSRKELQEMIQEMKGKSLVLGVEVRA